MLAVILAHFEDPVAPLVVGDIVADEVGVSHGKKEGVGSGQMITASGTEHIPGSRPSAHARGCEIAVQGRGGS